MDKNTLDAISDVLKLLKSECMQTRANPTENNIHALMCRYNMLFVGGKLNTIYSTELHHALKEKFGIEISEAELTSAIPNLCSALKMKCDPLVSLSDVGKKDASVATYSIELY